MVKATVTGLKGGIMRPQKRTGTMNKTKDHAMLKQSTELCLISTGAVGTMNKTKDWAILK